MEERVQRSSLYRRLPFPPPCCCPRRFCRLCAHPPTYAVLALLAQPDPFSAQPSRSLYSLAFCKTLLRSYKYIVWLLRCFLVMIPPKLFKGRTLHHSKAGHGRFLSRSHQADTLLLKHGGAFCSGNVDVEFQWAVPLGSGSPARPHKEPRGPQEPVLSLPGQVGLG